jgi:hypothetical protein
MPRYSPERLDFYDSQIGESDAIALSLSTTLRTLCTLACEVDWLAVRVLARNATLKTLSIGRGALGCADAIVLARNTVLQALSLTSNAVGDEGAVALARNTTLLALDLSQNEIGDTGAIALAQNTTLLCLNLSFNRIGDAGGRALAESLEAGNECALSNAELGHVKRAIGQHAFSVLRRYVGTGNRSLRYLECTGGHGMLSETLDRMGRAMGARAEWG